MERVGGILCHDPLTWRRSVLCNYVYVLCLYVLFLYVLCLYILCLYVLFLYVLCLYVLCLNILKFQGRGDEDSDSEESDWEPEAEIMPPEREQTRSGRQRKRPSFFQVSHSSLLLLDFLLLGEICITELGN